MNKVEKPNPTKKGQILYPSKKTGHSPISFLLSLIAIIVMFYIAIKYINDTDSIARSYAQYSFMLAGLGLVGFITLDYLDDGRITIIPKKYTTKDYIRLFVIALIIFVINALIQFFLAVTIRFAMTLEDRILYFIFAAPCEELFFRAFIIGGLTRIHVKWYISVPISAVAFMGAHTLTYIANLPMYLSTLFGGLVFGAFYYRYRDIGANQFGHLINNVRAIPNVLVSY